MNRRRTVTALLASGLATGSMDAYAQSGPSAQGRTIGLLSLASTADVERFWLPGLRAKLAALGWVEGQNLVIERAFANYQAQRLPALAQELIRKRVDLIWASLPEATIAAARATRTIPIVFINVAWPVEQGLIESYARPGRNVTGVASYTGLEVSTKRLDFLKALAPNLTRLSWILGSATEPTVDGTGFDIRPVLEQAARSLGYDVRFHFVRKNDDLEAVFAEVLAWRAQALAVAGNPGLFVLNERIAAFALGHRLPTASVTPTLVEAGGLLSYNAAGLFDLAVPRSLEYVDQIFRGARPADLPVDQPSRYELVVNLRTARALGLHVPQTLLLLASRVIE